MTHSVLRKSKLVIDRYWYFITDTDYLYVYVPDNDMQNRNLLL